MKYFDNLKKIFVHYGMAHQLNKLTEEIGELLIAISKGDTKNIVEEMADVLVGKGAPALFRGAGTYLVQNGLAQLQNTGTAQPLPDGKQTGQAVGPGGRLHHLLESAAAGRTAVLSGGQGLQNVPVQLADHLIHTVTSLSRPKAAERQNFLIISIAHFPMFGKREGRRKCGGRNKNAAPNIGPPQGRGQIDGLPWPGEEKSG